MELDRAQAAALDAWTQAFNKPSEGAVEVLHAAVFPLPGAAPKTAELVMCRLALTIADLATTAKIEKRQFWKLFKATALSPLIEPYLADPATRAHWDDAEERLLKVAFGPATSSDER